MDRASTIKITQSMIKSYVDNINTSFLAVIESYDIETGRATIYPKIKYLDNNGNYVEYASIVECPVASFKCGSFYLRCPYKIGDIVIVICSQDALDDLLISSSTTINNLDGIAKHRMQDAIIIGGVFVEDEKLMNKNFPNDFIIQNRANNDIIVLKQNGGIEINTTSEIKINAGETINITSPVSNIKGNVNIQGNVSITGNQTTSGTITGGAVKTSSGIDLDNHTHEYSAPLHPIGPTSTSPSK